MVLLEQLIEKKDLELYLKLRAEFLNKTKTKEILKLPKKEREFVKQRFQGRKEELRKLLLVVTNGKLKEKSKMYYHRLEKLNDEFDINNFPDLSDKGKKKQCIVCKKWDYHKNLTSEDGLSFYHPKCEQHWCY